MNEMHKDLAEVMAAIGYIEKDGKNDFHGYKYASAEKVLGKVRTELAKRGICVSTDMTPLHFEPGHAQVKVQLVFARGDERHLVSGIGEGCDKSDKSTAKAVTQGLKIALQGAFLLSWGDDPEADNSSDKRGDLVSGWKARIQGAKTKAELSALIPELQGLTTKKLISGADAKRLREAFEKQQAIAT
jgi:hypothetical protein